MIAYKTFLIPSYGNRFKGMTLHNLATLKIKGMRVLSKENNRKLDEIQISGLLDFSRLPQSKKTATEDVREIKGENIKS